MKYLESALLLSVVVLYQHMFMMVIPLMLLMIDTSCRALDRIPIAFQISCIYMVNFIRQSYVCGLYFKSHVIAASITWQGLNSWLLESSTIDPNALAAWEKHHHGECHWQYSG